MLRRLLAPIALLCAIACSTTGAGTPAGCPTGTVAFGGPRKLAVQLAEDDETRQRGLKGVSTLGADDGMAFLWGEPTTGTFWMQDTLIPLSIAFVGADGRIVTIREMTPCAAEPCDLYEASGPYVMAIEANAGWFDAHGVEVGDPARLERTVCL